MTGPVVDEPLVELGKTGLYVTPISTGAWAWGDRLMWGYGRSHNADDVREAFEASLEAGITFFDTAEVYGNGRSERFLGEFAPGGRTPDGRELFIATKFFPYPWRFTKAALRSALKSSLRRLNMEQVDLYQIHWPFPPRPVETWARALAEVHEQGLARAVGVSNYNPDQMRRAYTVLSDMGTPLASNQVEFSLIQRAPERSGLLEACRELGVTLLAYSPLGKGVLTGKYAPGTPPPGIRGRQYGREQLEKVQLLVQTMREIGRGHGGKTPAQVAVNWTICKGAIPIVGAKNARQAVENSGAAGWRLIPDEVAALDLASDKLLQAS
jgi:aryl-alcohol dehydrogenase-like predicted oxidoreductase